MTLSDEWAGYARPGKTAEQTAIRMLATSRSQQAILEKIARAEPLSAVLDNIAALVEHSVTGARCALLVLRNGRLYHACAAAVPRDIVEALDALPIAGSDAVPLAPFWTRQHTLFDISADPRWIAHRDLLRLHGIDRCWSCPVLSAAGEILGCVAAYTGGPPGGERDMAGAS